ncbi:inner membrane mitoribosome receptor Mba1p, mitochondrial [Trichomonascus vanleenenianus]|uniref:Mba1p n=1 Tax=Trichomonascus vanleenenianus TaxID=2268995 RepID=UPI003ECA88BC
MSFRIAPIRPQVASNILLSTVHRSTPTLVRYASSNPKARIQLQHLGVTVDLYVHPDGSHLPSWFNSPLLRCRGVLRRLGAFFQNTVMIGQFRLKSKITPRFEEWRNIAIQQYVDTNKAFVHNNLASVKNNLSIWCYEALQNRRKSVPKDVKMDWKLVKFNARPKVMCIQPMMLPDMPLTHLMLVYKMNTKQRLVKIAPGQSEPQRVERDIIDYIAVVYDASKTPADAVLAGSLFETPLNAPRPNPMAADTSENLMLANMKEKGDIFRLPPGQN